MDHINTQNHGNRPKAPRDSPEFPSGRPKRRVDPLPSDNRKVFKRTLSLIGKEKYYQDRIRKT